MNGPLYKKSHLPNGKIGVLVNFIIQELKFLQTLPSFFCVSFFLERKSERIERFFFHKNPFKVMYGRLPDQFADYWMTRFPKLLIHSWMAMHCIKREPSLAKYFDKDYDFVKVSDLLYSVYSVVTLHFICTT